LGKHCAIAGGKLEYYTKQREIEKKRIKEIAIIFFSPLVVP